MKPNCLPHVTPLLSSRQLPWREQWLGLARPSPDTAHTHSLHKIKFSISVKNTFRIGTEPQLLEGGSSWPWCLAHQQSSAMKQFETRVSGIRVCRSWTSDKSSDSVVKTLSYHVCVWCRLSCVLYQHTLPNRSFQHYKTDVILHILQIYIHLKSNFVKHHSKHFSHDIH